ncbi:fam-j protein [Plasmodium relictum]|uniref:Fam-j protein n=1 Tax=Plasmodium relictum TaxID=85471 RepID=A0A1J1GN89_PLARL|nr:fam-j protein [Plasmodium relictum]CRG84859.1 fam-j protein [Plasmodium relictum]
MQQRNSDLFLEQISSNMYTRKNSPSMRNFIDAVNIEQDEILDSENTLSHFPTEEKNSDSDNKDDFLKMSLVDTINLEKSKSCDIKNILDELQSSLMDSLIESFYPSFENENLSIHNETEFSSVSLMSTENTEYEDFVDLKNNLSEIPNTIPDSLTEPLDLHSEQDYSTIYTKTESSSISLMGIENVECEDSDELPKILEVLSTSPDPQIQPPDLPPKPENSIIHIETEPSNISLMGTTDTEHKYYVELQNALGEILSTLPDSQIEPLDLPPEHENSVIHIETEPSSISLVGTKDTEHKYYVELQNALGEIISTLPDSQIEPLDLPPESDYSTNVIDGKPFNVKNLINIENVEHEDSYNLLNIFNDSQVIPNYLEMRFLESSLEDHSSTIKNDNIPSSTSNLMLSESERGNFVELQTILFNPLTEQQNLSFYIEKGSSRIDKLMHTPSEKSIELENILPNISINQSTTAISDYEKDTTLVDEIEQTSEECMGNEKNDKQIDEQNHGKNTFRKQNFFNNLSVIDFNMDIGGDNTQSCKKKGKKRNYEDIDNLDDQNIGDSIYINPIKKCACNKNGENLVNSLSNIFQMEINCLSYNLVPSLQKLRDILNDDNKDTYNNLEKKLNTNILSLRHIISEEIQKINHSDLTIIKNYYDSNIEGNKLVRSINNYILSFRHIINHRFNKKEEIHERVEHFLKILHDSIYEHKSMRDLYHIKSIIINKFMHSKLFSFLSIQSFETFKRIFELFKSMDKLIKCVEESIKNGFLLKDRTYFSTTQNILSILNVQINATIRKNLAKLDYILNALNLSYEDYSIIIQTIFYFCKKENAKNMEKLRHYVNKINRKNSFKAVYDLLLEEKKYILWCYNEASKIFNLNLNDKNKEGILFNDLISNNNSLDHLSSLYEILMKLIGALFIRKQLIVITKIRKSLLNMNSLKKRKYISYITKKIINKEHQLNLLSQIEKEKCKMEEFEFNIKNLHLFISVKEDIKYIKVSNDLKNKMKEIISILRFVHVITYKDEDRTSFNHEKKGNTENILLALYYANERLIKFIENEMQ